MITLPASPSPNGARPELVDFGTVLRPIAGGELQRINRAGGRWKWDFSFPVMQPATLRTFTPLIAAAREQALRLPVPLLGVSQGSPGTPVVDGAGQSGQTLVLRGVTAAWQAKVGYWLHIADENGRRYLHQVTADATASGGGGLTLAIFPALRWPFLDGATVELASPTVEGLVTSDVSWGLDPRRLTALAFTLEEVA